MFALTFLNFPEHFYVHFYFLETDLLLYKTLQLN